MAMIESRVGVGQFVAGQLFADEAVVRLVGIQGPNHIVAVSPGVWLRASRSKLFVSAKRTTSSQ